MKCENCPYYGLEGIQNNTNWCNLYSAAAPIEGCEKERDAYLIQKKIMQDLFKSESQE
jgi:hypothetical protein